MIHTSKQVRITLLTISLWTIVETGFHISWIINSYLLTICQYKPTYYDFAFVYLTYFYRKSCDPINITNEALFLNTTEPDDAFDLSNDTSSKVLYNFLTVVLEKGVLPDESSSASRCDIYIFLFFCSDVAWIVAAVCLFVRGFWKGKPKYMSVLFYGPWMLICMFVCFLDVVASVHFGLDMIYIHSYTSWLKFIGVSNYTDFGTFDSHPSSKFIPLMPSTLVVSLFSRVFFVWLINVICFFIILFMAAPDICFKNADRISSKSRTSGGSKLRFDTGEELDLNSSEARIRNWQLFYGAIEANSTMASSTTNSSGTSNSTDHNSNSKQSEENSRNSKRQYGEKSSQDQKDKSLYSVDSGFRRYSDVTQSLSVLPTVSNNIKVEVLRGQLPWSYISPEGQYTGKKQLYTKNPNRKSVQIKDSVTDSSHL